MTAGSSNLGREGDGGLRGGDHLIKLVEGGNKRFVANGGHDQISRKGSKRASGGDGLRDNGT